MHDILDELRSKGVRAETIIRIAKAFEAEEALATLRERHRQRQRKYDVSRRHLTSSDVSRKSTNEINDALVSSDVSNVSPKNSLPPSHTLPLRKILSSEAKASSESGLPETFQAPTQAELERDLFRRGKQICGQSAGGLISELLKARQHDVALARSVIELAATKHNPREFVAATIKANGRSKKPFDWTDCLG